MSDNHHYCTTQPKTRTFCNRLVINKTISGYARIAWYRLLRTSLIEVVYRLVASCQQTCCKFALPKLGINRCAKSNKSADDKFQQPDFNKPVSTSLKQFRDKFDKFVAIS